MAPHAAQLRPIYALFRTASAQLLLLSTRFNFTAFRAQIQFQLHHVKLSKSTTDTESTGGGRRGVQVVQPHTACLAPWSMYPHRKYKLPASSAARFLMTTTTTTETVLCVRATCHKPWSTIAVITAECAPVPPQGLPISLSASQQYPTKTSEVIACSNHLCAHSLVGSMN